MYYPRFHVWLREDGSNTETTGVVEDLRNQMDKDNRGSEDGG